MKKLTLAAYLISLSALYSANTVAQQTTAGDKAMADKAASTAPEMADAEVRKVDKDAKKVTLKHGPIKSLDMPPMTMVFQVRDTALFDKMAAGDKIKFSAEQQQGAYVVTGVEKLAP